MRSALYKAVFCKAVLGHVSGVGWISGLLYTQNQLSEGQRVHAALKTAEERRIKELQDNMDLPMVYFDVSIKGKPVGRITYVLFSHIAPRAAENFRALFSGEKGLVPDDGTGREGAGLPYHFKVCCGTSFRLPDICRNIKEHDRNGLCSSISLSLWQSSGKELPSPDWRFMKMCCCLGLCCKNRRCFAFPSFCHCCGCGRGDCGHRWGRRHCALVERTSNNIKSIMQVMTRHLIRELLAFQHPYARWDGMRACERLCADVHVRSTWKFGLIQLEEEIAPAFFPP